MKKSNIFILGIMSLATVGLTGCGEGFLDVESQTSDDVNEYYTTDEHIQEALTASYDPLHWADWGNGNYAPINLCSDIMSDDCYPGGGSASDMLNWQLMFNFKATSENTLASLWTDEYSGVKRCNDLISYVDKALATQGSDLTQEHADSYTAQARVLRDYYYMILWKFWGNIPYFTQNLSGDYKAPQFKADEIYSNIVTDLEDVLDKYGSALPMKASSGNEGRVTKAFAYMIYAELVMYQNDESRYSKALGYMNEIIQSGQYALNPDFKALWAENGEWCSESIYEINYDDNNHQRGWSSPLAVGGTVLPRLLGPRGWTSGVAGVDNGWSFGPVRHAIYNMYSGQDVRRDVSIFDADKVAAENGIKYEAGYMNTGLFQGKYLPMVDNVKDAGWDADLNFNNNLRVYRYAETLLNAAELLLRTNGDNATALKYVNMLRERAGIADLTSVNLDAIVNERHLEFLGEGKRYWDLVRTGKAATTLVPDEEGNRTASWTESKKYLPIPQGELSADPNLQQNNY